MLTPRLPEYHCPQCECDVHGTWDDAGIGHYEFWGQTGDDRQPYFSCEVCGTDISEQVGEPDYA